MGQEWFQDTTEVEEVRRETKRKAADESEKAAACAGKSLICIKNL